MVRNCARHAGGSGILNKTALERRFLGVEHVQAIGGGSGIRGGHDSVSASEANSVFRRHHRRYKHTSHCAAGGVCNWMIDPSAVLSSEATETWEIRFLAAVILPMSRQLHSTVYINLCAACCSLPSRDFLSRACPGKSGSARLHANRVVLKSGNPADLSNNSPRREPPVGLRTLPSEQREEDLCLGVSETRVLCALRFSSLSAYRRTGNPRQAQSGLRHPFGGMLGIPKRKFI